MSEIVYCASPFCQEVGLKKCSRCMSVRYCSKDCQAAHWKFHKDSCLPQIQLKECSSVSPHFYIYEVNIGKFYGGAGILPQTQTKRICKETFSSDAEDNIIINIFAPKLPVAPIPSVVTIPPDVVLNDEDIMTNWETDIDPRSGLMKCAKITVLLKKNAPVLSTPPKTLIVRMIPKSELPKWFKADKYKKSDGLKIMDRNVANKILKSRGLRSVGEQSSESDSGDDSTEYEQEVEIVDAKGSREAIMSLKSANCPTTALIATLQTMVSLVQSHNNIQTMITGDVYRVFKRILSDHKDNEEIATLVAGLLTTMVMVDQNSRQAIVQAGLCEELVSTCQSHPGRSMAVVAQDRCPDFSVYFRFSLSGGVDGDATNIQKWIWAAIMMVAADPGSQRISLGKVRGLFKVKVNCCYCCCSVGVADNVVA